MEPELQRRMDQNLGRVQLVAGILVAAGCLVAVANDPTETYPPHCADCNQGGLFAFFFVLPFALVSILGGVAALRGWRFPVMWLLPLPLIVPMALVALFAMEVHFSGVLR